MSTSVPVLRPQNVPSFCSDSPTPRSQRGAIFTYLVHFLISISYLLSIEFPTIKVSGHEGKRKGDGIVLLMQS